MYSSGRVFFSFTKEIIMKFQSGDIVYSPRRKSTFILQSRERSGSQWYCILVDSNTHEVVKRDGEVIPCYVWEYDMQLVENSK